MKSETKMCSLDKKKRRRSDNWLEQDKTLLQGLIKGRVREIEDKNTDTNTNVRKKRAWMEVQEKFNKRCTGSKRTCAQLKSQWGVIKMTAKKQMSQRRQDLRKTGGGSQPQHIPVLSSDIAEWLPKEYVVDCSQDDSDINHGANYMEIVVFDENSEDLDHKYRNDSELGKSVCDSDQESLSNTECTEDVQKRIDAEALKKTRNSKDIAEDKTKNNADLDAKCRQELHVLQIEVEKKKIRNLDVEYKILLQKLKREKNYNMNLQN